MVNLQFLAGVQELSFLFVLVRVGGFIQVFSDEYVNSGYSLVLFRFFFLIFLCSMGVLILGGSFFTLFLGWEGLGLSSFFLVLFYCSGYSISAGTKTVLTNRIGDVFFVGALSLLVGGGLISGFILIFFSIFCFTKSAIFPFRAWLPAAMAAPTPVSALVHSSTLVTAGI